MGKQPYIPIYIGDWEQDTNCLSPLAEFALLKLVFKLFKSEKRGIFIANYRTLSLLFKSNIDDTKQIFQELIDNNILNISSLKDDKFEIISRRMMREANISEIRSNVGKSGGRGNKKQTKSKRKAKVLQNTEYDYVYEYDNNSKLFTSIGEIEKIFNRWLIYKKEIKEFYKSESSVRTALAKLLKFSKGDILLATEIVNRSIERGWKGFFEIKEEIQINQHLHENVDHPTNEYVNASGREPKPLFPL